jgi:hypothetical protein
MFLAGRSRFALLSFVGGLGAALLIGLFFRLTLRCGFLVALLSAVILTSAPQFQSALRSVSYEIMLAALAFWAAVAYTDYMVARWRSRLWLFVLLAAACALVNGRGLAVAFLPLFAEGIRGRLKITAARTALLAIAVAIVCMVPRRLGQTASFSFVASLHTALNYASSLFQAFGWVGVALAVFGCWEAVRLRHKMPIGPGLLGLIAAGWCFQSAMNVPWDSRYVTLAIPPMAAMFGLGADGLLRRLRSTPAMAGAAAVAIAAVVLYTAGDRLLASQPKPDLGYHRWFPGNFLSSTAAAGGVVLVAGSSTHEGALIAETALHDSDRRYVALRASKVLSSSTWNGSRFRLLYSETGQVAQFLDDAHVSLIVIETMDRPDIGLLLRTVTERPLVWSRLVDPRSGNRIRIYRRTGPALSGQPRIQIEMNRLRRVLKLDR